MRALVIAVAVSVIIGLNSSWARESVKKDETRSTRQSAIGLSPLNPYYSQAFNRSNFHNGLGYGAHLSPYTPQFDRPHTFRYSPQESITVIPNSQPNLNQYQAQQAHYNAQAQLRPRPQARLHTQPQPHQSLQQQQEQQQQQQLQYQQAQYQQQLQQAAQQAQQLQALQQPIQPVYYTPPTPLSFQNVYSTPAPALFSTPLFNVPAQQYSNLIDQGFFKYPVYVDQNLATTFGEPPKPMFMKKRTLQDLCAQYVPEEKTVIYVLSQNPREPPEEIEVPQVPTPTKPSKPEVYFVKYNTPEEAELAQKHIQAQYDALGGNSEISNEGLSPVTTAQEILNGAHNITRNIPLGNNLLHRH